MHILRQNDPEHFQMDFLVHTTQSSDYDGEILALGSKVIPCLHSRNPLLYTRNFRQVWHQHGPYHVAHSHLHHYSGYVLRMARTLGSPIRIAHSHNDTSRPDGQANLVRKSYHSLMKHMISQEATLGLACSRNAAAALYGPQWTADPRWRVLYYGIDTAPFAQLVKPDDLRASLGIPPNAFVIGHVGRFMEQKNHHFLVEIGAEVIRRRPNTYLLLVGEGVLRPSIQEKVAQLGIAERTIFAGLRSDVPQLMSGAMDLFLFPSLFEGVPVALLEAQASGLPCLISDLISDEVEAVPSLLKRQSIDQPPQVWAATILAMYQSHLPAQTQENDPIQRQSEICIRQPQALSFMQKSPFNIQYSLAQLEEVYSG